MDPLNQPESVCVCERCIYTALHGFFLGQGKEIKHQIKKKEVKKHLDQTLPTSFTWRTVHPPGVVCQSNQVAGHIRVIINPIDRQKKKRKERNNIKKYGLTDSCHEDENGQYESDENVEEPIDDAGLDVFTDCRIATAIVH